MNGQTALSTGETRMKDWLRRIRAEYLEVPGLHLTAAQMQRFWSLDPLTCEALLAALVDARFLRRTRQGAYVCAQSEF